MKNTLLTARVTLLVLLASMMAVCGCANQVAQPPSNLAEYQRMEQTNPNGFLKQTILMHNLQRMMDGDLPAPQRVDSLTLVIKLGSDDAGVRKQVSAILTDPKSPQPLTQAAMDFLLKSDYPDMAGYVVQALPSLKPDSAMRETILDWLQRHPTPVVLAEVVKLWAQEPAATGPNETRYRGVVERISGKAWDAALLECIDTPEFYARGSAMELLAQRTEANELRRRILAAQSHSDAMAAVQAFVERFDYLPANGPELLAAVSVYKGGQSPLADAAALCGTWRQDYGYQFNIRDFHLLSHLKRDPLRTMLRRQQLALEIQAAFSKREHVQRMVGADNPANAYGDRFDQQQANLTMADLWNLYLLNEMLSRPRVQVALREMSRQVAQSAAGKADPSDGRPARGGLIFYENGQAEAKLYRTPADADDSSAGYTPSAQAIMDGRNALCRFSGHFEKADNIARAGPTRDEVLGAKLNNYYGLVLTSIDNGAGFCAHYYNPQSVVISLGVFPFGK